MSFSPDTTALPGGAQTGLTDPTYDLSVGVAPGGNNSKLWNVTGKGGTQTGVRLHSISDPFTLSIHVPTQYKLLPTANPVTGLRGSIPRNTTMLKVVKGVQPAANVSATPMVIRISADIPAGADAYDPANIRAAWSLAIGACNEQSANVGTLCIDGGI